MLYLIPSIECSNNIDTESPSDQNFKRIIKKELIDSVEEIKIV